MPFIVLLGLSFLTACEDDSPNLLSFSDATGGRASMDSRIVPR